jgi:hypothetical protein
MTSNIDDVPMLDVLTRSILQHALETSIYNWCNIRDDSIMIHLLSPWFFKGISRDQLDRVIVRRRSCLYGPNRASLDAEERAQHVNDIEHRIQFLNDRYTEFETDKNLGDIVFSESRADKISEEQKKYYTDIYGEPPDMRSI